MSGVVHEVWVAIQGRKHQTARVPNAVERGGHRQCLRHVVAAGREEASGEVITVFGEVITVRDVG